MSGSERIGSLFSGVGGLDLGLEWAGLGHTVWQVERDEWCRNVLQKHWPSAVRYDDVREVGAHNLEPVDVICGGFPCLDLSSAHTHAGKKGLDGPNSGLWREYARIISELRPRLVIVENVAQWRDWLPTVRSNLYERGYSSVSFQLCASDVGAPHKRARVFVVAHANEHGESARALHAQVAKLPEIARACRRDWGNAPAEALGVADGLSDGVGRALKAYGNAVVPQVSYTVGLVARGVLERISR